MARQRTAEGRAIARANLKPFAKQKRDYARSGAHVTITPKALDERVRMIEASVTEGSGGWLQPADRMVLEILAETRMHLSNIAESGVISKWFRQQGSTRGKRAIKTPAVVETWYRLLGRALDIADALLLTPAARMRVLGSRMPSSQIKDLSGLLALAAEDDPNQLTVTVRYADGDEWRDRPRVVTEAPPASAEAQQNGPTDTPALEGDPEPSSPRDTLVEPQSVEEARSDDPAPSPVPSPAQPEDELKRITGWPWS